MAAGFKGVVLGKPGTGVVTRVIQATCILISNDKQSCVTAQHTYDKSSAFKAFSDSESMVFSSTAFIVSLGQPASMTGHHKSCVGRGCRARRTTISAISARISVWSRRPSCWRTTRPESTCASSSSTKTGGSSRTQRVLSRIFGRPAAVIQKGTTSSRKARSEGWAAWGPEQLFM